MFSGKPISGVEGLVTGLVNKCIPDDRLMETTIKMARQLLKNSWFTLRADKWLVNEGQKYTLEDGLKFERKNNPDRAPDSEERLKSFGKN